MVIFRPFILAPPQSEREFELNLKKLLQILEQLHRSLPIMDIFFPEGGRLKLPDWFTEWCERQGTRIHIATVQLHEIEQRLFLPPVSEKICKDYGLSEPYHNPEQFADAMLAALGQTPIADPIAASYTNGEVFEAAVRALGSNARKWSTFLVNEPALCNVLMNYNPAKVVANRISPASLMQFLPGITAPNDSQAIIAWAHLLNAVPDYYQTVIVPVAQGFQQLNPSLRMSELLLCLVGFFGTSSGSLKANAQLTGLLPQILKKKKWFSKWSYTNNAKRHVTRNIICDRWKFPGMRYALGAEFMRNLKWNGFKVTIAHSPLGKAA